MDKNNNIYKDIQFRLLILNLSLVIIGYAMTLLTDSASIVPMRILKYTLLIVSYITILKINYVTISKISKILQPTLILSGILLLFSLTTSNPLISITKTLTFIVPFIYLGYIIMYIVQKYSIKTSIDALINCINWVYLIPIVSYFISGGSLTDTNIYYISVENENTAFVSNHYGWSSTLFLVTGVDLLRNSLIPYWRKILIYFIIPIASYLILVSGNRTSWLCIIVVLIVIVFRYDGINITQKMLLLILPIILSTYLLSQKDSALNTRIKKTELQSKTGEARVKKGSKMLGYFEKYPSLFVTGIGVFNTDEVSRIVGSPNYHNSYFEILFGAGIPVFLFFLYLIVIRPGWNYLVYFSKYYISLPPLMIIPFFESNLTGGQFLFFPWFCMVILFSYSKTVSNLK